MDVLTPEQRRRNIQAIENRNTKVELLLAKSMWTTGIRYRKNIQDCIETIRIHNFVRHRMPTSNQSKHESQRQLSG